MSRIYLDSAPVIYSVEQTAPWAAVVDSRITIPGIFKFASDMTRMECRVVPIRTSNLTLLADFDDFFRQDVDLVLDITSAVFDRAAEIRAQFGFKTPDAIHLAAAVLAGCDVFLTNDRRLSRFTGITIEVIGP